MWWHVLCFISAPVVLYAVVAVVVYVKYRRGPKCRPAATGVRH